MAAHIVIGALFGDEGKGHTVDYLCNKYNAKWVIRFNGGSQAGHNVVYPKGIHHCFSQIGSGAFSGAKTFLSRFMMINPISLINEIEVFLDTSNNTNGVADFLKNSIAIDENAPVILEPHIIANRITSKSTGHGTCGKGIGELAKDLLYYPDDVIRVKDLKNTEYVAYALKKIFERKIEELKTLGFEEDCRNFEVLIYSEVANFYSRFAEHATIVNTDFFANNIMSEEVVFEGAQGILLDEWHGFHPYTTWTNTTQENAFTLLDEIDYKCDCEVTAVVRAFMTRHGSGPFMESEPYEHYHEHNKMNDWQGRFKWGSPDAQMLSYSFDCLRSHGPVDNIMINHLDVWDHIDYDSCILNYKQADGTYWDLEFNESHDVSIQQEITDRLMNSIPGKTGDLKSETEVIWFIEENTNVEAKYLSHGPYSVSCETV